MAFNYFRGPDSELITSSTKAVSFSSARTLLRGYHAIKLKVGRQLADDLAAVDAVTHAVGPDIPLRLDANGAWKSVAEAAHAMKAFAAIAPIAWIEQPLPRHNLDGLPGLARQVRHVHAAG